MKVTKEIMIEAVSRFERKVAAFYDDEVDVTYHREKIVTVEEEEGALTLSYSLELPINHLRPSDGSEVRELWRHKIQLPQEVVPRWFYSWQSNDRVYSTCHFVRDDILYCNPDYGYEVWDLLKAETIKTSGAGNGWEVFLSDLEDVLFEVSGIEREIETSIPWKDREFSMSHFSFAVLGYLREFNATSLLTPAYEIYLRKRGLAKNGVQEILALSNELAILVLGMVPNRSLGSPHQVPVTQLMNLRAGFGRGYKSVLWAIRQIGMIAHENREKYPQEYWNSRQAGMDMVAQWAIENRSQFWALAVRGKNYREVIRLAAPDVYKSM